MLRRQPLAAQRPPLPSAVLAPCTRRRGVMLRRVRFHVRCFVISPCAMPHHALCARITRFARVFNRLRVWRRCSPHVCVAPRCPQMPLLRSAARRRVSLVSASKASLTGRPLSPMSAPVVWLSSRSGLVVSPRAVPHCTHRARRAPLMLFVTMRLSLMRRVAMTNYDHSWVYFASRSRASPPATPRCPAVRRCPTFCVCVGVLP